VRWLVLLAAACMPEPYVAGMLEAPGVQLGCLDVAVLRGERPEAQGPVAVVELGNRCEHRIHVDLGKLRVIGIDRDGRRFPLQPYDPNREIRPLAMDARASGNEWIEMQGADPLTVKSLEIEVGAIALDEPRVSHVVEVVYP